IEDGWRGRQLLEATSGFLATRAIAGGGQNRPADCLQFHLAASAYLREVFLLFLVHCDRPFVGPVYEVILALVRNVRNGSISAEIRCLRHVRSAPNNGLKSDVAALRIWANRRHSLRGDAACDQSFSRAVLCAFFALTASNILNARPRQLHD